MKVTIQEVSEGEMTVRVENPHFLKSRKGCNLPGIILSMPFISEKDEADIRFGCRQDIDYIAASFTRRKEDVLNLRKILIDEKKMQFRSFQKSKTRKDLITFVRSLM